MKYNKVISTIVMMVIANVAFGQTATTLADIANGLIPQFKEGLGPLLGACSYIFGVWLGFKGVLKLKEYNETKGQQVKLQVPIILIVAATMFLALPQFINIGITTFGFDSAKQSTFKF